MDEIDAIGGRRFSEGTSADREIQRTLMELLNQLDGFDQLGKVFLLTVESRPASYFLTHTNKNCSLHYGAQRVTDLLGHVWNLVNLRKGSENPLYFLCVVRLRINRAKENLGENVLLKLDPVMCLFSLPFSFL